MARGRLHNIYRLRPGCSRDRCTSRSSLTSGRVLHRVFLTTAVVVAGLLSAEVAQAYKLGGKKWPTRTITYHAATPQYDKAIKSAVTAWNASGANIRFKPVSRQKAKLRIVYGKNRGAESGRAVLGWIRPTVVTQKWFEGAPLEGNVPCGARLRDSKGVMRPITCTRKRFSPRVWLNKVPQDKLRDPRTVRHMAKTVAHELGHTLGLHHVHGRCAVMRLGADGCPEPPNPWQLRCRLLEKDDVRGAIRRYGGQLRPLAPEFCDAAPPAPLELVAAYVPEEHAISVAWRKAIADRPYHVSVAAQQDQCPATPEDGQHVRPLDGDRVRIGLSSEDAHRYCVSAWSADEYGLRSAPISTWVDVPARYPDVASGQ